MSAGLDIKFVEERYAAMSDDELKFQVTNNAGGLTPEALEVAKNEIKKRGMSALFADALEYQNRNWTAEEIASCCTAISNLACPVCGSNTAKLNATRTADVISFIVLSKYKERIQVACPDCLDRSNNAAMGKTIALGWWGFPWGIIWSVKAIAVNVKHKRHNHAEGPNELLQSFVTDNIGDIHPYKNDPARLTDMITTVKQ